MSSTRLRVLRDVVVLLAQGVILVACAMLFGLDAPTAGMALGTRTLERESG